MATRNYPALADKHPGETSWSITFPYFPGVTSVAETVAEIPVEAKDALATAIDDMEQDGEDLPPSVEDGVIPSFDGADYHDPRTLCIGTLMTAPASSKRKQKIFFSEEKKQKTFSSAPAARSRPWPRSWERRRNKSLLVLFFRKEHISLFLS